MTASIEEALRAAGERVTVLAPSPPVSVVAARAAAAGWDVMVVDGRRMRDRASVLSAIADGCDFPDWFGHNLDALHDCLGDLGWRPGDRHLLLVADGRQLRDDAVLDVLGDAVAADGAPPLAVLLLG